MKGLSASVADAIEFFMRFGHPSFQYAEGTIEFIRIIDKLFDVLNVRNPFGKGFKTPLRLSNCSVWGSVIESSITYLIKLKCGDGTPLVKHRRKTFIIGFITSALCAKKLAMDLMLKHEFQYFLTYKFCQDHLELLFACIRGKNGFNNNSDLRTFKSALKSTYILRNSIIASRQSDHESLCDVRGRSLSGMFRTPQLLHHFHCTSGQRIVPHSVNPSQICLMRKRKN